MSSKFDLYESYTETSALAQQDAERTLRWSESYFLAHYAPVLPADRNARILEVGCGYGRYLKTLDKLGYRHCYGIDISEQQVSYAQSRLGLSNVEKADALVWLEGKDDGYDCVLILDVLEHLNNDDLMALGEKLYRSLKPGGTLIVQVPNGLAPLSPFLWGDLTHVRAFTVTSLEQFLRNVGFRSFRFGEVGPHVFTSKDHLRTIAWRLLIKPALTLFMKFIHGGSFGGIYTANIKAVAHKDR